MKYEEAVEEGGERWSKPHVSSLPMEALMELQVLLANCPVLLDLESYKLSGVAGIDFCFKYYLTASVHFEHGELSGNPNYRKFPKYSDTQNICCNHFKI